MVDEHELNADGWPSLTGKALLEAMEGLQALVDTGKAIVSFYERLERGLVQQPAPERVRRFEARERRRRNEALRQMAAYRRRMGAA